MAAPSLPFRYRLLRGLVRLIVRLFFREVAVQGRENVPADRGGLLVAWHPNGLIDPALILAEFPERIVFGARDGLLRWPLLGAMMRGLGTVPIYRAVDQEGMSAEARREANAQSLGALADEIAGGSFSALFPEGQSHDHPHLTDLRTGAARLYLLARERTPEGQPPPVIVPVGLHYEDKDVFRTDVLVAYHPPMELPADLTAEMDADSPADEDAEREQARRLTDAIEDALVRAVHPTADWTLHALMHRARSLMRAEGARRRGDKLGPESVVSRTIGFAQIWEGYRVRSETHPGEIEDLRRDITGYDRLMRRLGLADADLDHAPALGSPLLALITLGQLVAVYLLLPPLLVLGYAVNAPPYWLLKPVARAVAKTEKDAATIKLIGGFVLFPLAWITAGVLAALGAVRLAALLPDLPDTPVLVGLVVAVLSALGGVVALRYTELAKGTWRGVRVRLTRRRHPERLDALRDLRADLFDRFFALTPGLDIPTSLTRRPAPTTAAAPSQAERGG